MGRAETLRRLVIIMVGPALANGPAATLNQQDVKFLKTNKVTEKVLPDKIISSTNSIIPIDKFRLGADNKIDTTISFDANGEWKGAFYLNGIVADTGTRVYSSHLDREFKFINGQIVTQSVEFNGDSLAWLGLMGDTASIKVTPQLIDADGKLTMTLTATDPFSKVRAFVFNDAQLLEMHFNDGSKMIDSSCMVQFMDVDRGDGVSFTLRLVKDFEAVGGVIVNPANPLIYPPNLDLWLLTEKGTKSWPQNYMELSVQDTVRFMEAILDGKGGVNYVLRQSVQALFVNPVEGYKYPDRKDADINWYGMGKVRKAIYELGERNGGTIGQKTYILISSYTQIPDSVNSLPVLLACNSPNDPWAPQLLFGDLSGMMKAPDYTPAANWFVPSMINNMRKENFTFRFARNRMKNDQGPLKDGNGVIGFRFEKAGNDDGLPYYLKDGKMDYGDIVNMQLVTKGVGTDTVYANNQRVRVIDNRHIKIMDNNTVSWAGERYYNLNGVMRPYDKQAPTGVSEQPVEIYGPALSISPNPASDGVTIRLNQPAPKDVKLYLYTPQGQQVGEVKIGAGEQQANVSLDGLSSGIIWVTDRKHGLPLIIIK